MLKKLNKLYTVQAKLSAGGGLSRGYGENDMLFIAKQTFVYKKSKVLVCSTFSRTAIIALHATGL